MPPALWVPPFMPGTQTDQASDPSIGSSILEYKAGKRKIEQSKKDLYPKFHFEGFTNGIASLPWSPLPALILVAGNLSYRLSIRG